mgnify:CR=1 FL=1|jgi:hypothetical protein|tara:strand:- start:803 stop:1054 length:252 start_codon:yes stop_codon:yes gene_type:complete
MIHQKQKISMNYPKLKDDAQRLINAHLLFDSPSKGVVGEKLEHREALQAAIITAKELARESAKSHWYKVVTFLEDKQQITYGR